jgi:hypothetical protein
MRENIALKVINEKLDAKKSFSLKDLSQEILDRGGILQISASITIRKYLGSLISLGALDYSVEEKDEIFSPTELSNNPAKWKRERGNPFITARDQDVLG